MKNLIFAAILTLTIMGIASADITILNRFDYVNDKIIQTVAMITPKVDFWGFNVNNPNKSDYEIGKELQINSFLKAGGNVAFFPGRNEFDLVPSLAYKAKIGTGTLSIHGGIYIPLNGKAKTIFSRESSLTYKASKNLEIGLAGTYSQIEGKAKVLQFGLLAKVTKGPASLKLRWLAPNDGAPTKVRIETCLSF